MRGLKKSMVLMDYEDRSRQDGLVVAYHNALAALDTFLRRHGHATEPWRFDTFGWAEVVFTPFLQRFAFIEHYEGVGIPAELERVTRQWQAAVAHPAAHQTLDEEVIKLYYDYARGAGNGTLLPGRTLSSFTFNTDWRGRPTPPKDKWGPIATDGELGLL